ncbi:MAG: RdgB/HAM1 family non-canonical purine NTP pyrophosphatase [Clostridia bacterium]|nr:RdgB/HAM1 family non-canonical purine NTP pyrophosphatase [Clostridia bacterium]
MELKKIIVASGNEGKIKELRSILKGVKVISMREAGITGNIEENGSSFKENALIKAKAVSEKTGEAVLADDSGLCVDFLGGAPGIYSARFSGEGSAANRALLLKRMQGAEDRSAHFECAVCLYMPDGKTYFGTGKTYGKILEEECGEGGFGYDPLFYSDDLNKSFGQASAEEKNGVSHRNRAINDLLSKI